MFNKFIGERYKNERYVGAYNAADCACMHAFPTARVFHNLPMRINKVMKTLASY